jgi:hypothetical protein
MRACLAADERVNAPSAVEPHGYSRTVEAFEHVDDLRKSRDRRPKWTIGGRHARHRRRSRNSLKVYNELRRAEETAVCAALG